MKKILCVSALLFVTLFATGCQKRTPSANEYIPKDQIVDFQVWTAQEPAFVESLVREFISSSKVSNIVPKVISFSDEAELQTFLTEKMAEGSGPDVIFTEGSWIKKNPRKILPLANDETFTAAAFRNTFMRATTDLLLQDQQIFGVPIAVDTLATIYNEEHLVDRLEARNTPGKTWEDFRKDVERLTQEDNSFERFRVSGAALGRLDNIHHSYDILKNLMTQMGTQFFSPDGMIATFGTHKALAPGGEKITAGIEAVKFFTSFDDSRFKNYSWNEFLARDENKNFTPFATGKTSMVFGYARDLAKIEDLIAQTRNSISDKVVRVGFFPQVSSIGSKDLLAKVYSFAVPRTAEYSKLSWEFLKFTSRKDIQSSFFGNTGLPSPRLDLVNEQSQTPKLGIFVRQAKFAHSEVFPFPESELQREFEFMISTINTGQTSADTALQALEKHVSNKLQKYQKREKEISNNIKQPRGEKK